MRMMWELQSIGAFTAVSGSVDLRSQSLCSVMHIQSYSTLWGAMDCSPPGSSLHGNFQARILSWVAISYSNNR